MKKNENKKLDDRFNTWDQVWNSQADLVFETEKQDLYDLFLGKEDNFYDNIKQF